MIVKVYGWERGFSKVYFNRHLRNYLGYSIQEAKDVVDTIMNGGNVELEYTDVDLDEIKKIYAVIKLKVEFQ